MNAKAKFKIAKTAEEQDFSETVLDVEIDFDEINLNINKNQVIRYLKINFYFIYFSIRIYLIYLNLKIILIRKENILNIIKLLMRILIKK